MTVEDRHGDLSQEADAVRKKVFPLFGHEAVSPAVAVMEGISLFAARVDAFHTAMQSSTEHFQSKQDLVEHTNQHHQRRLKAKVSLRFLCH